MTEVRVGFVGAGGNARGHMNRLSDIEGVNIVAICDVVEETAAEAAETHSASAYIDHHDMLDEVEMDALYVSVPPFAHTDAEIIAAQAGIHLFVEKPVVLNMDTGLEILEAIREAGVLSCVGYQLRLMDTSQRVRAYLADRQVAMISSHRWGGLPGTPWWRVMDQSGGQLHEQTTHQLDLMRFCTGDEVVEVCARYDRLTMDDVEGITIPDSQGVLMTFASGTIATIVTSPMMTQGGGKSDISFLLRDQIIGWSPRQISVSGLEAPELEAEPEERPSIDEVFVQAIREGDQSLIPCSYEEGLRTCDVTLAANRSAETGRPVAPQMAGA
ncbi:MAG: Gfo/Idh/MocA family oxidoreductase [Armatimonadota bacterium]|nr:Gfo/Idh/MocA family oxidoreductase [Armatimonadota bacterium]